MTDDGHKSYRRALTKSRAFDNGPIELPVVEASKALPAIDHCTLLAAGLDPACLPDWSTAPAVTVHPVTQRQREAKERARITDEEWLAVHDITRKWRTNNVKHRDHRSTVEDALWLARNEAPWCALGEDRDKFDAFRQRCASWAKIGRWKELFDAATATDVWRSERLRELQMVVDWAERTCSRIKAGRATLHASVCRREG